MLYLVVGEVEVAQGLGHIREGAMGHHLELVVAQVQRLQLRVAEGITGKGSESETRRNWKSVEMNMLRVPGLGLKPILLALSADITNLELERKGIQPIVINQPHRKFETDTTLL